MLDAESAEEDFCAGCSSPGETALRFGDRDGDLDRKSLDSILVAFAMVGAVGTWRGRDSIDQRTCQRKTRNGKMLFALVCRSCSVQRSRVYTVEQAASGMDTCGRSAQPAADLDNVFLGHDSSSTGRTELRLLAEPKRDDLQNFAPARGATEVHQGGAARNYSTSVRLYPRLTRISTSCA